MPYADNDKQVQFHRNKRIEMRELIARCKDVPCSDCGVKYPDYVMQFDHVSGTKLFDIGRATAATKSLSKLKAEIDKCEVVCANCHAIRTHTRGQKWYPVHTEYKPT